MRDSRDTMYRDVARSSYQNPANSGSRVPVTKYANGGRTDIPMKKSPSAPQGPINGRPIKPAAPIVERRPPRGQYAAAMRAAIPQVPLPAIPAPAPSAPNPMAGFGGLAMPPVPGVAPQNPMAGFGGLPAPAPAQVSAPMTGGFGGLVNPAMVPQVSPVQPQAGFGGLPAPAPAVQRPLMRFGSIQGGFGGLPNPAAQPTRVPAAPVLTNPWGV